MDWDKDGTADERDEWIELYNGGTIPVDLGDWLLDDDEGNSTPYLIPGKTVIQPGGFAVFYRQVTGIILDDDGDQVRLLNPEGTVVDQVTFGVLPADASYSWGEDGTWHPDWPPTPGTHNLPPTGSRQSPPWSLVFAARPGAGARAIYAH